MVLRLKAWESRSPPGLQKGLVENRENKTINTQKQRGPNKGPFCCRNNKNTKRQTGGRTSFGAAEKKTSKIGPLVPMLKINAGWSSPVARQAHNLKVAGSNPAPATNENNGLDKNV